jgi:DNA polymerase-3 subunit gamma/tau
MATALYRKYRPTDFASVHDQEHIVSVLQGAIEKQAIPHALLFSGGRGTGKTTLARIFAQEIGTAEVDVYEIDAASNRGIDAIRELRDAVHTVPYESQYKVYIIDEVHMLTKESFNALLKTLEEPPSHVVFILATTEEEKLLDTILSRCQVFRFRSPSRAVLTRVVVDVAKEEGYELQPAAADLVAVAANGSFRDALGVTQKVLLASGDAIGSADEVAAIIGAPRHETVRRLLEAIATNDTEAGLGAIRDAVAVHTDMQLFTQIVLEYLRTVLLLRHTPDRADTLLAATEGALQGTLQKCATDHTKTVHSHTLQRLLVTADQVGRSPIPQLPLELAIIDLTNQAT